LGMGKIGCSLLAPHRWIVADLVGNGAQLSVRQG
jgi:hypothetical protein